MKVTEANLGAWVLRCNPKLTDPHTLFDRGTVDRWCVAANYRSALMQRGQPVLLWLTGALQASYPRGLWGAGDVTGPVPGISDLGHPRPDLHVPLRLELWSSPVTAADIAAVDGLADIEVLRQPQMANPSFLTLEEFRLLQPLMPDH